MQVCQKIIIFQFETFSNINFLISYNFETGLLTIEKFIFVNITYDHVE